MTRSGNIMVRLTRASAAFAARQEGVASVLTLFILMVMLMAAGLAVDVMRHERERVRLQGTLDGAVLAAAAWGASRDPGEVAQVVWDHFAVAGLSDALHEPVVGQELNHRSVSASASLDVPTLLMHMLGIDSLAAATSARAEAGAEVDVEVSLVLDVSNSMVNEGDNRWEDMRVAAKHFVRTMMSGAPAPGEPGITSISLVPYASSVNLGQTSDGVGTDLIEYYNLDRVHPYSNCVIFDDVDYNDVALSRTRPLTQYEHFDPKDRGNTRTRPPRIEQPRCPSWANPLVPLATDPGDLIQAIEDLEPAGSTAVDIGMRWGIAMLDPETRPVVGDLIRRGQIDPAASGRPLSYDEDGPIKIAVLMTDGNPEEHYDLHPRLKARDHPERLSNVWYDTETGQHSVLLRGRYVHDFPYERAAEARRAERRAVEERAAKDPGAPGYRPDPCNDVWRPGERDDLPSIGEDGLPRVGIVRVVPGEQDPPVERNDEDCEPRWYWVGERGTHDHPDWSGRDEDEGQETDTSRQEWRDPRSGVVRLTHREVFTRFSTESVDELLYEGARQYDWLSRAEYEILREPRREWSGRLGTGSWRRLGTEDHMVDRLLGLCTAAKNRGVRIFTIAFELESIGSSRSRDRARRLMSGCATSPEHYFDVEDLEIHEAFATIAGGIEQLRLTR